jgi:nitroimidazol reductase NimA-like FMN-containing flavoprotein (pyridoxamine 5'-phosphate oxidase superfamily)
MDQFTPTKRSRIKRLHERGAYDEKTVFAILDAGLIAHIGYVIDGQPFVTPTSYWRRGRTLYWHGSSKSRMLMGQSAGIPVCVTVTHLDGLVLARSGFHHSINYRSVLAFGNTRAITDPEEKKAETDFFLERVLPERNATLRPVSKQELKATLVIAMEIEEAAAKIRAKPPVDDEEDYSLPIWAGVLPIAQTIGALERDPRLAPGTPLPKHLERFASGRRLEDLITQSTKALE